jgi:hypothetical protein|tara:strand:- start:630 stop:1406 length:777 start_codon:yes stop_codon:yes gene_type:complete
MYKTISLTIIVSLIINSVVLNFYNNYINEQLNGQVTSINYIDSTIRDIQKDVLDVKARTAQAISSNELRNAYISIEDNKRFFEYEVKMSRKSIEEFIDKLNTDMEQINTTINSVIQNDSTLKEQLQYVLQEIELLKIVEEPVDIPVPLEDVRGQVEENNTTIESYPKKDCSFSLNPGEKNSTKGIQRAVDRSKRKGDYNITVHFDVNSKGEAIVSSVVSNEAPSRLESAVSKYVSNLPFIIKDEAQTNCEMSFKLSVT